MKIALHKILSSVAVFVLAATLYPLAGRAQKISYSDVEREDTRRTSFEIIGKVNGNILVFKNNRSENDISVYDDDMKLLDRVHLDYMNNRYINVDFIPYSNYCWMIYQYQKKSIVYCMGVKLDGNGKRISEPVELDTTRIGWSANNKIYTTIFSENKQQIMIFKINSRNQKNFLFTTLLFDVNMNLRYKHRMHLDMHERNDYFTDFLLDNEGNLVFGKFLQKNGGDYIAKLDLLIKPADVETFQIHSLNRLKKILDEIKIRVDNSTDRYLINSFYYGRRRGSIEGLYTAVWDKPADSISLETAIDFNDDLRKLAKGPDANQKFAFDDYFIGDIITRRDSGYVLIAESVYKTSRGSTFNRWNYYGYYGGWNNPWTSPMDYYYWSPYYSPWRYPWSSWNNSPNTRFHADNIMILSFDKNSTLEWSNIIPKSQYDDEQDALISYNLMNTGGQLHFLFNQYERRTLLLNDQSISGTGKVSRHPTLKNLDRGYEFMPKYGKQISARSVVMPCQYRNYLCFAKIDF